MRKNRCQREANIFFKGNQRSKRHALKSGRWRDNHLQRRSSEPCKDGRGRLSRCCSLYYKLCVSPSHSHLTHPQMLNASEDGLRQSSHHLSPEHSWHVVRWLRSLPVDHVESRPATATALEVVLRSRPQQRTRLVFGLMLLLLLLL